MDLIPKEVWTNKMHEYNVNHYMDLYAEGGRKNVIRWKCLSTLYKDLDFNPPLVAFLILHHALKPMLQLHYKDIYKVCVQSSMQYAEIAYLHQFTILKFTINASRIA